MIPTINVTGRQVGRIGLGLMQLTWIPPAVKPTDEVAFASIKAAIEAGATFLNSSTFYGNPDDPLANLRLLNRFFDKYPDLADKVVLSVKGGYVKSEQRVTGEINRLREDLHEAKAALGSRKVIDIYEISRVPQDVSLEETIANLVKLKEEGLFRGIGLSEATAETLRKANSIHPIAAIEIELSLWSLEEPNLEVVKASKELGIPLIAYSPLGRGFLTGKYKKFEDLPEGDLRRFFPRFIGDNFAKNLELVEKLKELAAKVPGRTTAELALAYLLKLSPEIIPIPGSSSAERVAQNISAANIVLSDEEIKEIDQVLSSFEVAGTRYPAFLTGALMK